MVPVDRETRDASCKRGYCNPRLREVAQKLRCKATRCYSHFGNGASASGQAKRQNESQHVTACMNLNLAGGRMLHRSLPDLECYRVR